MNKCFNLIFPLYRTPLSSMFSIPLTLRGKRRTTSLVMHSPCYTCLLYFSPGHWVTDVFTRRLSTGEWEVRIKPRGTGNGFKRCSRMRITGIHCTGIPGHFLLVIPGHCVVVISWSCLSGCYTRRLIRMRVLYPVDTTLVQR